MMRLSTLFLAPALSSTLVITACTSLKRLYHAEQLTDFGTAEPISVPASQRQNLIGQWFMKPKEKDALVPNIVFALRPDNSLTLSRDDSGGTNFAVQLHGTWSVSSLTSDQITLVFDYSDVQPKRICYALPGGCQNYETSFQEEWVFTLIGPNIIESPGAVWHREPLLIADHVRSDPAAVNFPTDLAGAPRLHKKDSNPVARPASSAKIFTIHLASVRASAAVPAEWRRLAKLHPGLVRLGPRAPQAVVVPGKGVFYRVLGGAFSSRTEAQAACSRLRAEGQDCTVVAL